MRQDIDRLSRLARNETRTIVGLMSGTSLDGLDVALCRIHGSGADTRVELMAFDTVEYDESYRQEVRSVFAKRDVDLETVCILNAWIGRYHGNLVSRCLDKWRINPKSVDLIASHGQTIYHAPRHLHQRKGYPNATLQIGDGDHLAVACGIATISDFRQKHIASGGEGAPLAMYGDVLVFANPDENRILLNIGGIANLSWLPIASASSRPLSTDIGPGNTMMDAYVRTLGKGLSFDADGNIARRGAVQPDLLAALKGNEFFALPLPKTIGPELFNIEYLENAIRSTGVGTPRPEDILATLSRFAADCIISSIKTLSPEGAAIFASGGGIHNPLLIEHLSEALGPIASTRELGIDPDAKEAVAFAVLANECIAGNGAVPGFTNRNTPDISMGKISLPA